MIFREIGRKRREGKGRREGGEERRKRKRKREKLTVREKHQLVASCTCADLASNLQL